MSAFNNGKLRECRKNKGYTQKSFADLIGVARTTYAEYEQGKIQPPLDKVQRICRVLNLNQDELSLIENDTGINPEYFKHKRILTDAQKITMMRQIQCKVKANNDMERIKEMVNISAIDMRDKDMILSILNYISVNYMLTEAEQDTQNRMDKAMKETLEQLERLDLK